MFIFYATNADGGYWLDFVIKLKEFLSSSLSSPTPLAPHCWIVRQCIHDFTRLKIQFGAPAELTLSRLTHTTDSITTLIQFPFPDYVKLPFDDQS